VHASILPLNCPVNLSDTVWNRNT